MPMRSVIRSLLAVPRVPNPPVRVWRDWALLGFFLSTAVLELVLREDLVWGPLAFIIGTSLIFTLLWRRTKPLLMVTITFGTLTVVNIAAFAAGVQDVGLYSSLYVALLPYSLMRWASGRDSAIGMAVVAITTLVSSITAALSGSGADAILEPVIGGSLFLLLPAALGALVRYETNFRSREIDHVKLTEREQLARELHDTVAHHVSAIIIQAQAGRTIAATDPHAATSALKVIEEEATRTLTEMRMMVGALRDDEEAELAPRRGIADIDRISHTAEDMPRVHIHLTGELDDLMPSVDTAIYRLAQESITNAIRHARHATVIDVSVAGDDDCVRLTVSDDGDAVTPGRDPAGYGLVGMTERATILGGTLEAGPKSDRGWIVSAVLPKTASHA